MNESKFEQKLINEIKMGKFPTHQKLLMTRERAELHGVANSVHVQVVEGGQLHGLITDHIVMGVDPGYETTGAAVISNEYDVDHAVVEMTATEVNERAMRDRLRYKNHAAGLSAEAREHVRKRLHAMESATHIPDCAFVGHSCKEAIPDLKGRRVMARRLNRRERLGVWLNRNAEDLLVIAAVAGSVLSLAFVGAVAFELL